VSLSIILNAALAPANNTAAYPMIRSAEFYVQGLRNLSGR